MKAVKIIIAMLLMANITFSEKILAEDKQDTLSFNIRQPRKMHKAIKCLLLCIGENQQIENYAKTIKFDLEFTDQLAVELKKYPTMLTPELQKKLFNKGISLCLYCAPKQEQDTVTITLKDTFSDSTIFEKEYPLTTSNTIFQAHTISEDILPKLTGGKGVALSSLAYCKQFGSRSKGICIADYSCSQEKLLISGNKLNVAPRWHSWQPQLFFSQFTKHNGQLMSCNLQTKLSIPICSYDGLNMQPAFSSGGDKVVLCLSARNGNSELYLYDQNICKNVKKRVFVPLTNNGGNNTSPCILPNNDVIFCSDFETGLPQLYYLNMENKKVHRLTQGAGYCAAPSYSDQTNSIVYTKPVKGVFQLWCINLDEDEIKEQQITFGPRDKLDPSWSPCGNYIAFTYDYINKLGKRVPQIASFNVASKKIRILTKDNYPKSFPTWTNAPHYQLVM